MLEAKKYLGLVDTSQKLTVRKNKGNFIANLPKPKHFKVMSN